MDPAPSHFSKNAPSLQGIGPADVVKSSLRREPDALEDLLRGLFGNVTEPLSGLSGPGRAASGQRRDNPDQETVTRQVTLSQFSNEFGIA
jgi:hypothetical protein